MTDLFSYTPPPSVAFAGKSYQAAFDYDRLSDQLKVVHRIMSDGRWHFLPELVEALGCKEQSASARVRDLRKEKYGSHNIQTERVSGGLYRYRMVR